MKILCSFKFGIQMKFYCVMNCGVVYSCLYLQMMRVLSMCIPVSWLVRELCLNVYWWAWACKRRHDETCIFYEFSTQTIFIAMIQYTNWSSPRSVCAGAQASIQLGHGMSKFSIKISFAWMYGVYTHSEKIYVNKFYRPV